MRRHLVRAFTLVELLVVIAIIGTLVALLLPAVQSARASSRNAGCKNNLRQISLAFITMDASQKRLPGYVNALVDFHDKSIGRRASWAVMIFPYMEQQPLWDEWSRNFTQVPHAPGIEGLICPSDPPDLPGQPWLKYVVNAGWAWSDPDRVMPGGGRPAVFHNESLADGVFFDVARNTSILDVPGTADHDESRPELVSTISYVQTNDGASKTLMVSESVHTWFWAYDADTFTPGYEYGAKPGKDNSPITDTKHAFGFVWSTSGAKVERVNGDNNYDVVAPTLPPASMPYFAEPGTSSHLAPEIFTNLWESWGFPSSRHSGGVNAAFCDGRVVFIAESISPKVYTMLMTPNRNKSRYVDPESGLLDRKLAQPTDGDY